MTPLVSELLLWAVLAGVGAVGLTTIIRNAPFVRGWVQAAKRPWACNVCMPLYTVAAMVWMPVWWHQDLRYAAVYPAAYALANVILDRLSRPHGPPPLPEKMFPDTEEGS